MKQFKNIITELQKLQAAAATEGLSNVLKFEIKAYRHIDENNPALVVIEVTKHSRDGKFSSGECLRQNFVEGRNDYNNENMGLLKRFITLTNRTA